MCGAKPEGRRSWGQPDHSHGGGDVELTVELLPRRLPQLQLGELHPSTLRANQAVKTHWTQTVLLSRWARNTRAVFHSLARNRMRSSLTRSAEKLVHKRTENRHAFCRVLSSHKHAVQHVTYPRKAQWVRRVIRLHVDVDFVSGLRVSDGEARVAI